MGAEARRCIFQPTPAWRSYGKAILYLGNKPPGPNPHHSLVGSGKHPALPTVKKTSCEPKRCLLFLKKSFLTLRSS